MMCISLKKVSPTFRSLSVVLEAFVTQDQGLNFSLYLLSPSRDHEFDLKHRLPPRHEADETGEFRREIQHLKYH